MRRFEKIFGFKIIKYFNKIDNFDDAKDKIRHKIVFDLIDRLLEQNNKVYNNEELLDIASNSIYFKNEEKNRALFFKSKGKLRSLDEKTQVYYTNVIQSLLACYGISFNTGDRVCKNGKRTYVYSLSVDEQIKNIVEFKYNECNKVNFYKSLFKN